MTPLELLAVGVIVVVVWMCGMRTAERHERGETPDLSFLPFVLGMFAIGSALFTLLILGVKEAAK